MIRGTVRANRAMGKINTNDGTRGRCHSRKDCVDRNEGVALAVGALTLRSLSEGGVFDGKKHADGQQSRYDRVPFLRERVIYRRKDCGHACNAADSPSAQHKPEQPRI